jgi:hypothetical protein
VSGCTAGESAAARTAVQARGAGCSAAAGVAVTAAAAAAAPLGSAAPAAGETVPVAAAAAGNHFVDMDGARPVVGLDHEAAAAAAADGKSREAAGKARAADDNLELGACLKKDVAAREGAKPS